MCIYRSQESLNKYKHCGHLLSLTLTLLMHYIDVPRQISWSRCCVVTMRTFIVSYLLMHLFPEVDVV
jgi:hypothetical protein